MSSFGTRATVEFRYLGDGEFRLLGDSPRLTGPPPGVGEGAVLLGRVVADGMDPHDLVGGGDLHRAAHDGDLDGLAPVAIPDPVGRPGEAHTAAGVDDAGHRGTDGGHPSPTPGSGPIGPGSAGGSPLGMRGYDDALAGDLDQPVPADHGAQRVFCALEIE
jgi:hypothetical protein